MTTNPPQIRPDPKPKTQRDKAHRKKVEQLPCCACGEPWSDRVAHHENARGHGAKGKKCSDYRTIPMCGLCHLWRHDNGRDTFWAARGMDPEKIIKETLIKIYGDDDLYSEGD